MDEVDERVRVATPRRTQPERAAVPEDDVNTSRFVVTASSTRRRLVRELPFDPERKRMTLIYEEENGPRDYFKGALEVVLAAALVGVALYVPASNEPLGTVPLDVSELTLAAMLAVAPFLCVELGKGVFRRAGWALGPGADR